ncbi:conserved hypothetical protein [metagenome]|uniref:YbhB/YbcL family Raf kinase inhibitor-like protein n=1 Tax=metagenome TaxID=256318 RepID=A0A2P2CC08_9ZZZZ
MKINRGTLQVAAAAFDHGAPMPQRHSVDGIGVSPELSWVGAPEGTASFALVVHDPDAPVVDGFTHWVVYGIPASTNALPEGVGADHVDGLNSKGTPGWYPAAPPPGHGTHHYFFHLYALDAGLPGLPASLGAAELLSRIDPHILNQARVVGTFRRDVST